MWNYFISGFLSFASFSKIQFLKFKTELKQNRGSMILKILRKSNKNNLKTKVQEHCSKIIFIFVTIKNNGAVIIVIFITMKNINALKSVYGGQFYGNGWNTRIDKADKNRKQKAGITGTLSVINPNFFSSSFQIWEITEFIKIKKNYHFATYVA